jgi:beta-1,4-mannosyltransferase
MRAADLIALPYKEILNSGSAILALSFDRPILVPAAGALAELSEWSAYTRVSSGRKQFAMP